ncbi:hypothetical protein ABZV77_11605 [Streptomyces sp. NPDC004732]|uniref:hypothetical protein n=1 Tax=Streptomyces sp. NPDC004732 TaxID=3154290 RepID=UPI0033B1B4E1
MADESRYEVRLYKWQQQGNPAYDDPKHAKHQESLKIKGWKPLIAARNIPIHSVSWTYRLDEISQANVSIPIDLRDEVGLPGHVLKDLEPYKYCVGIFKKLKGKWHLMWGGIIWTMRIDLTDRTLDISARDFFSFFENRHWAGTGKDKPLGELIHNVFRSTQKDWGINVALTTDENGKSKQNIPAMADRKVSWQYTYEEWKEGWEIIQDFVDSQNGFFINCYPYIEQGTWDTKNEKLRFAPHCTENRVPRHPTTRYCLWTDVGIRDCKIEQYADVYGNKALLDHINCEVEEIYFDGTQIANVAYAIGTNNTTTVNRRRNNKNGIKKWPVRDAVARYHQVAGNADLDAKADTLLAFGDPGIRVPRIVTYPNAFEDPTRFNPNLGVKIAVKVNTGFMNVSEDFVVTQADIRVEADGTDRVALSLTQAALFRKEKFSG